MKIIDLTQGFYKGLKPYNAEWYPKFDISVAMTPETDPNGTTRTFSQHFIFPHNATHAESSLHFFPDGTHISDVPLDTFVGKALVADLSYKSLNEPITDLDLENAVGDLLSNGDRLLIHTGYLNKHWDEDDYWDKPPYLTAEAANWMVSKKVKMVGFDCLTEKPGDKTSIVHRTLLENEIPIIEYMKNMHQLSSKQTFLVALPMLIEGVEASAVRVIAIEGLEGKEGQYE